MYGAGISASSAYGLSQSDVTSSKVKIELAPTGSLTGLTTIGTSEQLLAEGKLIIQNIAADPGISYNLAEMQSMSKFYESGIAQLFDTVIVEGDWRAVFCSPVITKIYPDTLNAGVGDTLFIMGTCFDTIKGSSEIEFTDSEAGPYTGTFVRPLDGDYIFWTNTLIAVKVPSIGKSLSTSSSAGTGYVKVNRNILGTAVSPKKLYIRYAFPNTSTGPFSNPANTSLPLFTGDYNGLGGVSIYFANNFKSDSGAVKAFKRALKTWRCATRINYSIQDSALIPDISSCGKIEYKSLPVGVTTVLATTNNNPYTFCPGTLSIAGNRKRFAIAFNSNLNWYTDTLMPTPIPGGAKDLESRSLHELGHAHFLNHSNNINDLMYYTDSIIPFEYRRTIQYNDNLGGNYVVNLNELHTPTTCHSPMVPINPADCATALNTFYIDNVKLKYELFPNPANDKLQIEIEGSEFIDFNSFSMSFYDMTGRIIFHKKINNYVENIDTNILANGLYILFINYKNNMIASSKVIIQHQ